MPIVLCSCCVTETSASNRHRAWGEGYVRAMVLESHFWDGFGGNLVAGALAALGAVLGVVLANWTQKSARRHDRATDELAAIQQLCGQFSALVNGPGNVEYSTIQPIVEPLIGRLSGIPFHGASLGQTPLRLLVDCNTALVREWQKYTESRNESRLEWVAKACGEVCTRWNNRTIKRGTNWRDILGDEYEVIGALVDPTVAALGSRADH